MNDAAIDTTTLEAAIREGTERIAEANEADMILDREAAAISAVAVVMRQCKRQHPTRKSAWAMCEIARMLHELAADPGAEVKLGDQFLGKGVAPQHFDETKAAIVALGNEIKQLYDLIGAKGSDETKRELMDRLVAEKATRQASYEATLAKLSSAFPPVPDKGGSGGGIHAETDE